MLELKYPNIFKPLRVGPVMLRNRLIAAPINTHVSKEKATSGVSLIVLGDGFVSDELNGRILPHQTNPYAPENLLRTKEKLEFWRQGGAKVSIELLHCGMFAQVSGTDWVYGVCAGKRPDGTKIVEVDREAMDKICDEYYRSAARAKQLGFDMVTAHFAHGWLPSEFLSPTWNYRTDEFGGSYENRIKFPRMILQAVRRAVGKDFPIDMRINGKDWVGPGQGIEEVARFVKDMSEEHLVDMVNISAGADILPEGNVHMATHAIDSHLTNIELSKYVKEHVDIPVTVVGAVMTPDEAEMVVRDGYADAVWLGRSLFADPDWVKKAYVGKPEDIRPCLRCLYCFGVASDYTNFGCSVNPRVNKEEMFPVGQQAKVQKRVTVIGGGPGGLKAALTASEYGHIVTLIEKSGKLGGTINFTDYVPSKQDLHRYKEYLVCQVEKSNIDIHLNTEATPELIRSLNTDVLMIAVGASPATPPIKGIDSKNVMQALDVFPVMEQMEQKVVIIGGGTIGCELGIDLAEVGRDVTIVEMTGTVNALANLFYQAALKERMDACESLHTLVNTCCMEITQEGVRAMDANGKELMLPADRVIVAAGMRPNTELAYSFYGIVPETYIIGDCNRVGKVKEATQDGFFFAANIE